jgi:hypothetical protein
VLRRLVERSGSEDEIEAALGLLYGDDATADERDVAAVMREVRALLPGLVRDRTVRERERDTEEGSRPPKIDVEELMRRCARITATGCTDPPRPHEEIIVRFTRPDGTVEYQTVVTDEHGCFETFLVTVDEGEWKVDAEYPGSKCDGPARSRPRKVGSRPCGCGEKEGEERPHE